MMTKDTRHDEEDEEAWKPANHLVEMDHFVSKEGDEERAACDDDDACPTGDIVIDSFDQLRPDDDID